MPLFGNVFKTASSYFSGLLSILCFLFRCVQFVNPKFISFFIEFVV
jgi:hypothetical protein